MRYRPDQVISQADLGRVYLWRTIVKLMSHWMVDPLALMGLPLQRLMTRITYQCKTWTQSKTLQTSIRRDSKLCLRWRPKEYSSPPSSTPTRIRSSLSSLSLTQAQLILFKERACLYKFSIRITFRRAQMSYELLFNYSNQNGGQTCKRSISRIKARDKKLEK